MITRLELQSLLEKMLGSRNVYYQPPETVKISYPAIVYSRMGINNTYADDDIYRQIRMYSITIIDDDPDSELVEKFIQNKLFIYDRQFTSDNLYHNIFTINC